MKKNLKKWLSLLLVFTLLITAAASMVGCKDMKIDDPDRFDEDVDSTKTQIYVGYFNGGLGLTWLTECKEKFEALYPEYQIMIDTGKDEYGAEVLVSNIKTNRQDMYVLDGSDYYKFIKNDLLADLTDAVTTPLSEFGEDKTIESKMNESLKAFYKTNDGKFYASPLYQSYHQIVYDVDLFDQYSLWFKDGGGFVESTSDTKSAGQDGKLGTWDDGLPVTYSDFFLMMDRMVARGITPMTWTGAYADSYLPNFIISLIADYEGEDFATNFSFDGKTKIISNRDYEESPERTFTVNPADVETVTVTPDNFTDYMHSTVGKYYAAKFAKDIAANSLYRTYNYAESHTAVQRSFLMSNMEGVDKPIAMLIEGGWWVNEATSVFDEMATYNEKYAKENRRFGVMPLPKADDGSSAPGHTVAPFSGGSAVFVSNFSNNKEGATLFYRYLHTDEAMKIFTKNSGVLRPYDYDLTEIYNEVPFYVQNVIDSSKDTTFIYRVATGDTYKEDFEMLNFMMYGGMIATNVNGISTSNPLIFFCDNASATAKDYFLGMKQQFIKSLPAAYQ